MNRDLKELIRARAELDAAHARAQSLYRKTFPTGSLVLVRRRRGSGTMFMEVRDWSTLQPRALVHNAETGKTYWIDAFWIDAIAHAEGR